MKVLSIAELLCLTRMELLVLRRSLELQLSDFDHDSVEFREALLTLFNVRQALLRRTAASSQPTPS